MNALRCLLTVVVLSAAAQAGAAEKGQNIFFRAAPAVGALPLTSWGPGTLSSSPTMMGRLFPPTLIMQKQQELALTEQQTEAIKTQMRTFQSEVVDVQWDLQSSQATLDGILEDDVIDPDAAAAAIDRVLEAENALKRMHLNMLIRIRSVLEPEQIDKLAGSFGFGHGTWMPFPPPDPPPAP